MTAFTEDLTQFTADFGVAATVGAVSLTGIFNNAYQDAFGLVAGSSPVLLVVSAAAPSAAVGDSVTVGSTSYTIARVEPDGTGITRLLLQEA
ncbi:MAG: hypothetical protein KJ787_13925 [Gammaproteobacteria bacterium]|nr:hypothetical protein [Gammaproteobacteria bacterium]MBU1647425.1 hypothetical protein [Gammaproteobacteria bacterium]MBU1973217.1 hypothetical protein [Gammaproteobacteria bacterium]